MRWLFFVPDDRQQPATMTPAATGRQILARSPCVVIA